jgi:hypothetical protein
MVDVPFLQLTPGTRTGVVQDGSFEVFFRALESVREKLLQIIAQEKAAEEEQASRNILKSVQKAFKEAFLTLPPEDYRWFDLHSGARKSDQGRAGHGVPAPGSPGPGEPAGSEGAQAADAMPQQAGSGEEPEREFFDYSGPLYSAIISPASVVMRVKTEKGLRCIARDKSRRTIENDIDIRWRLAEGEGRLSSDTGEMVTFIAPAEPGLSILTASVSQGDTTVTAQCIVTVSETLLEKAPGTGEPHGRGLPGYTFLRAPGELWRSRYDEKNNIVVVNNGHRDYVYAAQKHARKLKYICRLFSKELVLANFPGFDSRELLERVIELSLYAEEHLK